MDTRRDFIKKTCSLCLALTGAGLAATTLSSCSSIPLVKANPDNGKIRVPVETLAGKPYALIRSLKYDFDLLLVHKDEAYHAMFLQCSHEMQPLTISGNFINCASHGSTFDLNGKVLKAPAILDLKRYPAVVENNTIVISMI
ncbi:MAG: Rieske (2Fe-2S) protein [Bacteroidia bacterium]